MRAQIVLSTLLLALCAAGCSKQEEQGQGQQQQPAQPGASVSSAAGAQVAQSQTKDAVAKVYRGSLNDRGFEMRLARGGGRVFGAYAYDGIGQELKLEGKETAKDKFELTEQDAAGRETGRWSCEAARAGEWDEQFSCKWTKPDGTSELFAALEEQAVSASRWRVAAKVFENRKVGVRASYPQIVGEGGAQAAAGKFNRLVEREVREEVGEFAENAVRGESTYMHVDYNVLLAADDVISVEFAEDSYAGGAHPNLHYWAMTYDLRADRPVHLEDIFKPNAAYAKAIGDYCAAEIKRRAGETAGAGGPPEESPVAREYLQEIGSFALMPKGLMIYYDLPHVIAALDRNFVPYSAVKDKLRPEGPAARLAQ